MHRRARRSRPPRGGGSPRAAGAELVLELAPTGELVSFGREVRASADAWSGEWTQCSRAQPVLFDDAAGCEAARKAARAVAVDLVGCEISAWPYEQSARDNTLAAFAARLGKGGGLWAIEGDRCRRWIVADGREAAGVVSSSLSIRRGDHGGGVETSWGIEYDPARLTVAVSGPSTKRTEGDKTTVTALGCYDTGHVRTRAPREVSLGATFYLDGKRCAAALAHQRARDRWIGRADRDELVVAGGRVAPGGC